MPRHTQLVPDYATGHVAMLLQHRQCVAASTARLLDSTCGS